MKILLWIIFIAGHIFVDRLITKDGGKPNYLAYFLIRGIVAILHGALFLDPDLEYWNFSSWELLKLWVPILAFQVSSFWVLYEFGRNIWSNQKALYYDSKEGRSEEHTSELQSQSNLV